MANTPDELPFERLYFRWDHLVNINFGTQQPRRRSIWRIEAHRPVLHLIPEDSKQARSHWNIEIQDNRMIWQHSAEDNEKIVTWERVND